MLVVLGTIANALTPVLLKEHPLLLIALEARNRNLLAVASRVDPVPFIVVAVIRRMLSDPLFFLLGHYYGDNALQWAERRLGGGERFVRLTESTFRRASGVMVFLFPGALVCVLAGVTGMRTRVFLALNFAGTLGAVLVLRAFAGVLESPIEAMLDFNDRNFKWLTAFTVLSVVGWLVWQRRQGGGEVGAIRDLQTELDGRDDVEDLPPAG